MMTDTSEQCMTWQCVNVVQLLRELSSLLQEVTTALILWKFTGTEKKSKSSLWRQ